MKATPPFLETIPAARDAVAQAQSRGSQVGLVPTMGALHEGHLSLVRAARAENGLVVVSIFVNPTQFGPKEDLSRYPRDPEGDRALAQQAGADVIFSPSVQEMYAGDASTWVEVEGLTGGLCGRTRPDHFRGVCTVVAKLFNICRPDRAYFGEKDAQQLAVINRMVRDLDIPVEIVPCPTVREPDGLAMSSRNAYLTPAERAQAPVLYRALSAARGLVDMGVRDTTMLERSIREVLTEAPLAEVEYVEIVRADDLVRVDPPAGACLIALAARFGGTRLIDNIRVMV